MVDICSIASTRFPSGYCWRARASGPVEDKNDENVVDLYIHVGYLWLQLAGQFKDDCCVAGASSVSGRCKVVLFDQFIINQRL